MEGSAGLTDRRLAIIDVSERGAQPMVDEDLGLTVVFDGGAFPSASTAAVAVSGGSTE